MALPSRDDIIHDLAHLSGPDFTTKYEGVDVSGIMEAEYNKDSVDKAIQNNRTGKIGKKEGRAIHALLKGSSGYAARKAAAEKTTKEEVEPIDELSKPTLGSYVAAAKHDHACSKNKNPEKAKKRMSGVNKAIDKIVAEQDLDGDDMVAIANMTNEEFDQLDEISKKTLGSYVKKSSEDRAKQGRIFQNKMSEPENAKNNTGTRLPIHRKIRNRKQGIDKAVSRLAKESVFTGNVSDRSLSLENSIMDLMGKTGHMMNTLDEINTIFTTPEQSTDWLAVQRGEMLVTDYITKYKV